MERKEARDPSGPQDYPDFQGREGRVEPLVAQVLWELKDCSVREVRLVSKEISG